MSEDLHQPLRTGTGAFTATKGAIPMSNASASDTDRIERSILIKAPRSRVWNALSQAEEFGKHRVGSEKDRTSSFSTLHSQQRTGHHSAAKRRRESF